MEILRAGHRPHHQSVCVHCHQVIVQVEDVGWIDPDAGDSYDLCPTDPYGVHDPA